MDFLWISYVSQPGHPSADSDAAHLAGRRLRAAHGLRAGGAAGRVVVTPSRGEVVWNMFIFLI